MGRPGGARPPREVMVLFVGGHLDVYGVEPICKVLMIAPSTYCEHKAREADPSKLPLRLRRDLELREHIGRIWRENFSVYGARKVWRQLQREGIPAADPVTRNFRADHPNQLWVADLIYVATWCGLVYVAFVIDVFSRRVVGWRVSKSLRSNLALDALEQAIHARGNEEIEGLAHHSNWGVQHLSIRYTERLAEVDIGLF